MDEDTVKALEKNYKQKIRFLNDERTTGTVLRILVEYGVIERKGLSMLIFDPIVFEITSSCDQPFFYIYILPSEQPTNKIYDFPNRQNKSYN